MPDIALLTGGTGTTGRRIAVQMAARDLRTRVATRTPKTSNHVRFEWTEEATWAAALEDITSVYLVAPSGVAEPLPVMKPFMEQAICSGVKRFVLLSASSLQAGGPMMGKVHAWLQDHAPEWIVLRPTWFMQNFSEQQHLATIRDQDAIYTATDNGRVGFIDADDIAAVAVEALSRATFESRDIILTGPAAITYDEVALTLSNALGRSVKHHRLNQEALAAQHVACGLPEAYAQTLAAMDASIAAGSEDSVTDAVTRIAGRRPKTFADFVGGQAKLWVPVRQLY